METTHHQKVGVAILATILAVTTAYIYIFIPKVFPEVSMFQLNLCAVFNSAAIVVSTFYTWIAVRQILPANYSMVPLNKLRPSQYGWFIPPTLLLLLAGFMFWNGVRNKPASDEFGLMQVWLLITSMSIATSAITVAVLSWHKRKVVEQTLDTTFQSVLLGKFPNLVSVPEEDFPATPIRKDLRNRINQIREEVGFSDPMIFGNAFGIRVSEVVIQYKDWLDRQGQMVITAHHRAKKENEELRRTRSPSIFLVSRSADGYEYMCHFVVCDRRNGTIVVLNWMAHQEAEHTY